MDETTYYIYYTYRVEVDFDEKWNNEKFWNHVKKDVFKSGAMSGVPDEFEFVSSQVVRPFVKPDVVYDDPEDGVTPWVLEDED